MNKKELNNKYGLNIDNEYLKSLQTPYDYSATEVHLLLYLFDNCIIDTDAIYLIK